MNTISAKLENAFGTVVASCAAAIGALGITNLPIYYGFDTAEKDAPCVVVSAKSEKDDAPHLGIWHVNLSIMVYTMAADSDPGISDMVAQTIFGACLDDNIKATLAAAEPTMAVYDVILESTGSDTDGDAWVQTLELEVIAVHNP